MAAYIKFDGVDGESQHKDHKGWSDVISFSQVIHKVGAGATNTQRRRGDTQLEDIAVTKVVDKSSPKIAEALCKGKVFAKVEIHTTAAYTDAGPQTFYAYELKNVLVTGCRIEGSGALGADTAPLESLSLNFEEIKVTYTEHDNAGKAKGKVEYSWKVTEGQK